jgi:hypothetical protein
MLFYYILNTSISTTRSIFRIPISVVLLYCINTSLEHTCIGQIDKNKYVLNYGITKTLK